MSARPCRVASAQKKRMPPGRTIPTSPFDRNAPAASGSRQRGEREPRPPRRLRARIVAKPAKTVAVKKNVSTPSVRLRREKVKASGERKKTRGHETRAPSPQAADAEARTSRSVPSPASRVGEPRREGRLAEDRQRAGVRPVEQRRLLEVRDAVQPRHDAVSGREHLAGDLGVPGLVRLGEPGARRLEPDRDEEERESAAGAPAAARGIVGESRGSGPGTDLASRDRHRVTVLIPTQDPDTSELERSRIRLE